MNVFLGGRHRHYYGRGGSRGWSGAGCVSLIFWILIICALMHLCSAFQ